MTLLDSHASLQIKVRTVVSLPLLCGFPSLRLSTEDTTQYAAYESHIFPEFTLNQDIMKLTKWFTDNCWMQPRLGRSEYIYNLSVGDQSIETKHTRKLSGIALDTNQL